MAHLDEDAAALRGEIVALRRAVHQEPELAWRETRTAARIAAFVSGHGLSVRSGVGGTGVLAETAGIGRGVLLRVDMDALPLQEEPGAPYASQVPNTMHACGHDGHV